MRLWITYDPTRPPAKWFTRGTGKKRTGFVRLGCLSVSWRLA